MRVPSASSRSLHSSSSVFHCAADSVLEEEHADELETNADEQAWQSYQLRISFASPKMNGLTLPESLGRELGRQRERSRTVGGSLGWELRGGTETFSSQKS
jgi:hypothetical protein